MFVRRKKNRSGTVTVAVVEKRGGKHYYLHTLGTSSDELQIARLEKQAHNWIADYINKREPKLDFEQLSYSQEKEQLDKLISCIDKALINGVQLILNNVFDSIGFNAIEDKIFRQLVLARLAFPSSKLATRASTRYKRKAHNEAIKKSRLLKRGSPLKPSNHLRASCQR